MSSASQIFLEQIDSSLQGLLTGYARLLLSAAQQQQYVKSTEQDGIKHEIASLQKAMSSDPPKVQEINQKRIEILTKRLGEVRQDFARTAKWSTRNVPRSKMC